MSYQVYITRAEFWAENEGSEISAEEWLQLVQEDAEITRDEANGAYFAVLGATNGGATPWLDWSGGNIYTNFPDRALQKKMLQIAGQLDAVIQGDDGEHYASEADFPEAEDRRQANSTVGDRLPAYKRRKIVWQIVTYGSIAAAIIAVNVLDLW